MTRTGLPDAARDYLADPSLRPLWDAVSARLERNGLNPTGTLTVRLGRAGADRLAGLLGRPVEPGDVRVRLADLDTALRSSTAAAGLVTVAASVTGRTLVDRPAARADDAAAWAAVWASFDHGLAAAGVGDATWTPGYLNGVRRSGLLTRAGAAAAAAAVDACCRALGVLVGRSGDEPMDLATLGGLVTGDAHAFDHGRLAAALVLRAAAARAGRPAPATLDERRDLWEQLGVLVDAVSGTVLVSGLRPPGSDRWSAMMRERADLGLVTHLTSLELGSADGPLAVAGRDVAVVENPQVLQAALRAGTGAPLVCLSGNPSAAGRSLLRRLVGDGAVVRYHGDFDWPGVAIARRVFALGAAPWRMGALDYLDGLETLGAAAQLPLEGVPVATPWDPRLAQHMASRGLAVHEEALLDVLLADLG